MTMSTRRAPLGARFGVALLALGAVACDALFGEPKQCESNDDCARIGGICGPSGFCTGATSMKGLAEDGGNASSPGTVSASASPSLSIAVAPATATVSAHAQQTFSVTAMDANGQPLSPAPQVDWSVDGGGTIAPSGVFTAGDAGGFFTITARAGGVTATALVTVTTADAAASVVPTGNTITIGEPTILNNPDSGNGNLVLAQLATLAQPAKLTSLSFYIATADGKLRLGLYDATGPNGGPGAKKAETAEFVASAGWAAVPVITPVQLAAGDYWLAYAPESSALEFRVAGDGTGSIAYFSQPYGPLPQTFSTTPTTTNDHWSFYATLTP
jgi:hypothetical protein